MGVYINTTLDLLSGTNPAFQPLSAALAASRSTQQSVVTLLLRVGVPTLHAAFVDPPAGGGGRGLFDLERMAYSALGGLMAALELPNILPEVQQFLFKPGCAALVQLAAEIVQALPVTRPAGTGPDEYIKTHAATICLLSRLCSWMGTPLPPRVADTRGRGGRQPTSGGSGTAAGGSAIQAGSQTAVDGDVSAWAVVRLLPHLTAVLQELASSDAYLQHQLAMVCNDVAASLSLLQAFRGPVSLEQLTAWAAAADAGLRLLPALTQLGARWRQRRPDPLLTAELQHNASVAFPLSLLLDVWMRQAEKARLCASSHLHQLALGSSAAEHAQLPPVARQLWQLHSTSCRLIHWLAREGAAALQLSSASWVDMVMGLQLQFLQSCAAFGSLPAENMAGYPGGELARCATTVLHTYML